MASQITSSTIVYSTVYSGEDERKHQSSASLSFVRGIHRWSVNSAHKGPVTRKTFSFDDVIMSPEYIFKNNKTSHFNSLWPIDIYGDIDLGQHWLTKPLPGPMSINHSDVFWHSPEGIFTRKAQNIYHWYWFEICSLKVIAASPGGRNLNA